MPLRLNVGLTKKVGEANYGSKGASVNLEMELDSTLVSEPAKLKEKISQLFRLVRESLHDELNGGTNGAAAPAANGNDARSANGNGTGHANGQPGKVRPVTQSQIRALQSIAKAKSLNLGQFLHEQFHVARPEDLTIKQASEAIDRLKQ